MRSLRCVIGRHTWEARRNPDKGGAGATYHVCSRCGRQRTSYDTRGPANPLIGA